MSASGLNLANSYMDQNLGWMVEQADLVNDIESVRGVLLDMNRPCFLAEKGNGLGIANSRDNGAALSGNVAAFAPAYGSDLLGDQEFRTDHGTKYSYYGGAMANGIASEEMVIALGRAGYLGSFGAGGLVPSRIEEAILRIQKELPNGPYAFNFIHSPSEPALERGAVDLYLKYGVPCVEAAAFIDLTENIVYYRVAGLKRGAGREIVVGNRIIAKISRREVAIKFMQPAPEKMVAQLLSKGMITQEQADMAKQVPMADDITAEADSGGHTDNRPMVSLLPSIIALRNGVQAKYKYKKNLRVGVGGGIGTPEAALAAFAMGAAYVVTGSVNQACLESGASPHTKKLLAQADMADVIMAPASDMFEMGVKLQVLKRGTLFAMRGQKLYNLYNAYNSIEEIPAAERLKIEKQIFRRNLDDIWKDTVSFFKERDPMQIDRAMANPKKKMALIFRWYLGLASRWSNIGEKGREMDYQIWCGPCMGAFNNWTCGTYLEKPENRNVVDVASHLMAGAAYLFRIQTLQSQGVQVSPGLTQYIPKNRIA